MTGVAGVGRGGREWPRVTGVAVGDRVTGDKEDH